MYNHHKARQKVDTSNLFEQAKKLIDLGMNFRNDGLHGEAVKCFKAAFELDPGIDGLIKKYLTGCGEITACSGARAGSNCIKFDSGDTYYFMSNDAPWNEQMSLFML